MTNPATTLPVDSTEVLTKRAGAGRLARWHAWESFKKLVKWPFYRVYEQRMESHLGEYQLPQHLGMIMDGNRRFARDLGSDHVSVGHQRGAEKLWQVLNWCYDAGIPMATVWSFSIDNFNRDTSEVEALLQLFEEKTRELINHADVHAKEVRVRYIGKLDLLPESLQEAIRAAEAATARYDKYFLNIAMAYGGREEIMDALKRHLEQQLAAGKSLDEVARTIDENAIESNLYTQGLPEPDLILRTSGEVRLSGFLLWQSAYSEFYFCDTHWPAFRRIDFLRALRSHHLRQRRFGR
ncbi:MAG: di-trans,poly-cis-decaprenylcistransferase [Thermoanaerobaculia bacterium]|nr:di-trans,poly-cis-decaprenylcistransferase [Thermoanaerobaculia bacterium]